MTKTEEIVSNLSKMYFYSNFVYDNLYFEDSKNGEKELADIVIQISDKLLIIQIKERGNDFKVSHDLWFRNKVLRKAHGQHKTSAKYIEKANKIIFENVDSNSLEITEYSKEDITFLTLFENDYLSYFKKDNNSKIIGKYNIMRICDFDKLCQTLVMPIEILKFLRFRLKYLEQDPFYDKLISSLTLDDGTTILANVGSDNDLIDFFISSEYNNFTNINLACNWFREFILVFKTISDNLFFNNIMSFLQSFDRKMIDLLFRMIRDIENRNQIFNYIKHRDEVIIILNESEINEPSYFNLMNEFLHVTECSNVYLVAIRNREIDAEFSFYWLNKKDLQPSIEEFNKEVKELFDL